jgi:DNA-binding Xre family transcriptional regulator
MLQLDLLRLMEDKGIQNPNQFLVKSGFTYYTAHRLLKNKVGALSFRHIEELCMALHCTIDDLFNWKPDQDVINIDKHPLQKLKGRQRKGNINTAIKDFTPEKLDELRKFIHHLGQDEPNQ